jgi:hypothetical protein
MAFAPSMERNAAYNMASPCAWFARCTGVRPAFSVAGQASAVVRWTAPERCAAGHADATGHCVEADDVAVSISIAGR